MMITGDGGGWSRWHAGCSRKATMAPDQAGTVEARTTDMLTYSNTMFSIRAANINANNSIIRKYHHYYKCINRNKPCIQRNLVCSHRKVVCGGTRHIRCYRSCGWNLRKSPCADIPPHTCACSRSLRRKVRPCCTFQCPSSMPDVSLMPPWPQRPARLRVNHKGNIDITFSVMQPFSSIMQHLSRNETELKLLFLTRFYRLLGNTAANAFWTACWSFTVARQAARTAGGRHHVWAGLPLTGVRAYYTPENLAKTPNLDEPAYEYVQNIIAGVRFDDHSALLSL